VRFPAEAGQALSAFQFSAFAFPFPATSTLPDRLRAVSGSYANPATRGPGLLPFGGTDFIRAIETK
ncbi:hypothetical protein, partial [uncultured Streptomyces sp.]|uniref:hypothetical protein n=1 Tax=uncultured Streptomyces sp. TaxID=174707 RepID=UPI00262304B0